MTLRAAAQALLLLLSLLPWVAAAGPVRQVPEGGKAIPVIRRGVVCSPMSGGWTLSADGRSVQPPPAGAENMTRQLDLKVAEDAARCASSEETVTVIATGALAAPDSGATTFVPDEGRLELRGQRLQDVSVVWSAPGRNAKDGPREGKDLCLNPTAPTGSKPAECIVPLPSGLPADTDFTWVPSSLI